MSKRQRSSKSHTTHIYIFYMRTQDANKWHWPTTRAIQDYVPHFSSTGWRIVARSDAPNNIPTKHHQLHESNFRATVERSVAASFSFSPPFDMIPCSPSFLLPLIPSLLTRSSESALPFRSSHHAPRRIVLRMVRNREIFAKMKA